MAAYNNARHALSDQYEGDPRMENKIMEHARRVWNLRSDMSYEEAIEDSLSLFMTAARPNYKTDMFGFDKLVSIVVKTFMPHDVNQPMITPLARTLMWMADDLPAGVRVPDISRLVYTEMKMDWMLAHAFNDIGRDVIHWTPSSVTTREDLFRLLARSMVSPSDDELRLLSLCLVNYSPSSLVRMLPYGIQLALQDDADRWIYFIMKYERQIIDYLGRPMRNGPILQQWLDVCKDISNGQPWNRNRKKTWIGDIKFSEANLRGDYTSSSPFAAEDQDATSEDEEEQEEPEEQQELRDVETEQQEEPEDQQELREVETEQQELKPQIQVTRRATASKKKRSKTSHAVPRKINTSPLYKQKPQYSMYKDEEALVKALRECATQIEFAIAKPHMNATILGSQQRLDYLFDLILNNQ